MLLKAGPLMSIRGVGDVLSCPLYPLECIPRWVYMISLSNYMNLCTMSIALNKAKEIFQRDASLVECFPKNYSWYACFL